LKSRLGLALLAVLVGTVFVGATAGAGATAPATQCAPAAAYPAATTTVAFWSTEATINIRREFQQAGVNLAHWSDEQVLELGRRIAEAARPILQG
jgi:ABC-type glycerol-3-phosphate transport system substrate-binding protein